MQVHYFVAALVLAGGKSSRMGQDKALLTIANQPLLQRVCQVATAATEQVYLLTPWPERYQGMIADPYQPLQEVNPGQGPLMALAQGLPQISAEWVLLLACDLPLLQPLILQQWIQQLTLVSDSILAAVPQQNGRWEPLCGFYRHSCFHPLQQFLKTGGRSFQIWLNQISVAALPMGDIEIQMLGNCNTPEQFSQLTSQLFLQDQ